MRATLLALVLYVAKLVIDAVVTGRADLGPSADWLADRRLRHVARLVGIELGLAVTSDLLSRATNSSTASWRS